MVCGRCLDDPKAHDALYPDCGAEGYCDLHDHAVTSCPDRASAVAVLTQRGRMARSEPSETTTKESETRSS